MWRSIVKHSDEVQGDQIEMHESIQGVHGAMSSEIQDGDHSEVKRSMCPRGGTE